MKIIILAGGSGTRLWPLSQSSHPKQFLRFGEKHSLLQKTLLRFLSAFPATDIFIVAPEEYASQIHEHAEAVDPQFKDQILLEPAKKNTAPAIAFAARALQQTGKMTSGECFLVSPSDHLLSPEETFLRALPLAEELAKQGTIVTFGIRPHRPETGYGYIQAAPTENPKIYTVESFVEKPDSARAQQYLLSGKSFWNAGIFVFEIEDFFRKLQQHCPQVLAAPEELPDISIDYALLEKCGSLKVLPLDVSWSDVGTWESLYEVLDKDQNRNATLGNVKAIDTKNCLILGGKRLISTIGIEDLVIIETDEALFLGKRGESQRIKALIETLKHRS